MYSRCALTARVAMVIVVYVEKRVPNLTYVP